MPIPLTVVTSRILEQQSSGRSPYASAVPGADPSPRPFRLVVRVWLPDRPGALGLVASRIGALGADIVGIDVLERTADAVIDEFAVALPGEDLVGLLVREIEEVDGVVVDEWLPVQRFPDPRLDALDSAARICAAATAEDLHDVLVCSVQDEFGADWVALLRNGAIVARCGRPITEAEEHAATEQADPARGGDDFARDETADDAIAGAPLPAYGAALVAVRDGHPFRRRERKQLRALARVADRIGALLEPPP